MTQDGVNLLTGTLKITAKNFIQAEIPVYGAALPGAMLDKVRIAYGQAADDSDGDHPGWRRFRFDCRSARSRKGCRRRKLGYHAAGSSAILFADGSFECRGVTAGRHVILVQDKSVAPARVLAASIVVGDKDLNDLTMDAIAVMPTRLRFRQRLTRPEALFHWHRFEEGSRMTRVKTRCWGLRDARWKNQSHVSIDSLGLFQIPGLLPGAYELTVEGSSHSTIRRMLSSAMTT